MRGRHPDKREVVAPQQIEPARPTRQARHIAPPRLHRLREPVLAIDGTGEPNRQHYTSSLVYGVRISVLPDAFQVCPVPSFFNSTFERPGGSGMSLIVTRCALLDAASGITKSGARAGVVDVPPSS